ncbi:MAG: hypothetical protein ABI451_02260 [Dokdonella sp.]
MMNSRSGILILGLIGMLVLSACGSKGDKLTDAELAKMLHSANQPDNRIDANAVNCLRAWSDDNSLTSGLPAGLSGSGRDDCRRLMQGWLDDPARNPDKLMFVEVATPTVTKRAMDLLAALPAAGPALAESTPTPNNTPPSFQQPLDPAGDVAMTAANANAKFSQASTEVDALCAQARDIATNANLKSPDILKRIEDCAANASKTRERLTDVASAGNPFAISMITRNSDNSLKRARKLVEDVRAATRK